MKFCQKCGAEINVDAAICVKCGGAVEPIKKQVTAKLFFILAIISTVISAVFGGIVVYQNTHPKYYGAEISILKEYAQAGSRSAVADLQEYYEYTSMEEAISCIFIAVSVVSIVLWVVGIVMKIKKDRDAKITKNGK